MPNKPNKRGNARKPRPNPTKSLTALVSRLSVRPKPKPPRQNNRAMTRRPNKPMPHVTRCQFSAVERVAQVLVPTSVTPGTLLWTAPANPLTAPRLQAIATQFDSWYGEMTLEVETTGNSFSQDYVVLKHVPNGDPSRLPTNITNLLNLAETSDVPGTSARLQLDSNKSARVVAKWSTSYNPRKPIVDSDPSDCNNGLFIIVADGSPGSTAVNLTVRLKYNIHFYGAFVNPVVINSSQLFTGTGTLSASSFLGTTPTSLGFGSATATANTITFPLPGSYIVTTYATGTTLSGPTAALTGGTVLPPSFVNPSSGSVAMGTFNITTTVANATLVINQAAASITSSYAQINPLKFS